MRSHNLLDTFKIAASQIEGLGVRCSALSRLLLPKFYIIEKHIYEFKVGCLLDGGVVTSIPPSVSTLILNCSLRPKAISTWMDVQGSGSRVQDCSAKRRKANSTWMDVQGSGCRV